MTATIEELEERVARIEHAAQKFRQTFEASDQLLEQEIRPGSTGQIALANSIRVFILEILEPRT